MTLKLGLLAAAFLALPIAACVASDDGDHVTVVPEFEPNDTAATATKLNGGTTFYAFFGQCTAAATDKFDWFEVEAGAGPIVSTLYVSDHPPAGSGTTGDFAASSATISLAVMDGANAVIAHADAVTPSTPAKIDGTLGAPGTVRLKLQCPTVDVWYSGSIRIP